MRVLYCYKFGILGGVCTQLINRLEVLGPSGAMDAQIVFWRDMGISKTLAGYAFRFEQDARKVRDLAADGRFDAVVVIDTPEYLEALHDLHDVPLITEIHTTTELGLAYLKERNWTTAGYIVPSEYSKRMLLERFGIGRDAPVRVVADSIDARLFPKVNVAPPGPRPVFCWIGKLDDHKDWRSMLKLARRIVDRGVDAEFWIVGGETAPAHRQDALIDTCERLDLHPHIRWFPRIEYRAMHRVYAAVRASGGAALVTSIDESFGMSVLEAVVCGCPVLASRVGALPDIAKNGSYVRFYELGDLDEAAGAAVALLRPAEATRVREEIDADRDRLLADYSSEAVGPRYLDALRELCARSTRAPAAAVGGVNI